MLCVIFSSIHCILNAFSLRQDLDDLYYYVQVVEHGGFSQAVRALDMPKSKLSRRIGMLEERLGVWLILRSTRIFAVTELGQAYYTKCSAMLVETEAAQIIGLPQDDL